MENLDKVYMRRCLELASLGLGNTAPNPMVGCVIVYDNKIIGEGYHHKCGEAHAEVNAINAVSDTSLLNQSTLYVCLEPCAHYGKTPPCADLIVKNKIPKVVIGCIDSFSKVAGKGVEKLKNAGVDVSIGILEKESRELNKRFFTFHEKKRPYIILKYAQTKDGFIGKDNSVQEPVRITGEESRSLVHRWRSEEQSIMVGKNTALLDNPHLTVRGLDGKNLLRIVLDRKLTLPKNLNLFNNEAPTIVFTATSSKNIGQTDFKNIDFSINIIPQILDELYKNNIQSLIVEGGKQLLQSFIDVNLWDEARVFTGDKNFGGGTTAPVLHGERLLSTKKYENDILQIFKNMKI